MNFICPTDMSKLQLGNCSSPSTNLLEVFPSLIWQRRSQLRSFTSNPYRQRKRILTGSASAWRTYPTTSCNHMQCDLISQERKSYWNLVHWPRKKHSLLQREAIILTLHHRCHHKMYIHITSMPTLWVFGMSPVDVTCSRRGDNMPISSCSEPSYH